MKRRLLLMATLVAMLCFSSTANAGGFFGLGWGRSYSSYSSPYYGYGNYGYSGYSYPSYYGSSYYNYPSYYGYSGYSYPSYYGSSYANPVAYSYPATYSGTYGNYAYVPLHTSPPVCRQAVVETPVVAAAPKPCCKPAVTATPVVYVPPTPVAAPVAATVSADPDKVCWNCCKTFKCQGHNWKLCRGSPVEDQQLRTTSFKSVIMKTISGKDHMIVMLDDKTTRVFASVD